MSKLDNNNSQNHTAHYLVSSFLMSKYSQEFNLDPQDLLILVVISNYIDMNKESKVCFAKRATLSKITRISPQRLSPRLTKLCSLGLIEKEKKWKVNNYKLGYKITEMTFLSQSTLDCQEIVTVQSGSLSQSKVDYDHSPKRTMTIDNKNNIIKNRLYTPSLTLPHPDEPDKMCAEGERSEVYLNSDGFLVERESTSKSPIVQNIGLDSRHFLNFTSEKFNKVYGLWLGKKSRSKSALIWRDNNLELIAEHIIEHLSFRVANDHEWITALAKGEPRYIGKLENWLANEGWHDYYHKIGNIENAKNSRLNEQNLTTAQRAAAAYEWARGGDEDNTPF